MMNGCREMNILILSVTFTHIMTRCCAFAWSYGQTCCAPPLSVDAWLYRYQARGDSSYNFNIQALV
jgi:hypothetical protein